MRCTVAGIPLQVDFTVTEPGDPGRTRGPVENCYAPEPPEITIDGVQVAGIEIGSLLSEETLAYLEQQIIDNSTLGGGYGRAGKGLEFGG